MKLLKQNDTAGGLIFKQNTAGKALKQNHNFGIGFWKGSSINAYIEIPDIIDIQIDFSILTWFNTTQSDNPFSYLWLIRDQLDKCFLSSYRVNTNKTILSGGTWNTSFTPIISSTIATTTSTGLTLGSMSRSGNNLYQWSDNKPRVDVINASFYTSALKNIYLGLGNASSGLGYNISPQREVYIYQRSITNDEQLYLYNNRLGNDALSVYQMKGYYKLDNAEILTYNSVDSVCVRDYSGLNNHGKIINLPAGTLEQQLTYANANLFKL